MRLGPAALLLVIGAACARSQPTPSVAAAQDSAFEGVQRRGAMVMGVDQYASRHIFEDLEDGGRIIFEMRDSGDAEGVTTIRAHLRTIADSFAAGVFSDPAEVHAQEVPGTAEMARLRDRISYRMSERPGGGELRLVTSDPDALAAIHRFLAFQRSDHRAAGHEGMDHQHEGHE